MSSPELGPEQQALVDALAVEHAAVFGYGVVAAFADRGLDDAVSEATAAHRALRDATAESLRAAGVEPPVAAPGYTVPFPVTDSPSAIRLAEQIENDGAVAWRSVVERARSESTRGNGIDTLTQCAVRAARWRTVLGAPAGMALPGRP